MSSHGIPIGNIALASIALTAGLTSALCSVAHLVRSIYRDRREEEQTRILTLNSVLCKERDLELGDDREYGEFSIQWYFDVQGLTLCGVDRSRTGMLEQVTHLQTAVIANFTQGMNKHGPSQPSGPDVQHESNDDVEKGVLNTLVEQLQRLSEVASTRNAAESPPQRRACPGPYIQSFWQTLRCPSCYASSKWGQIYPEHFKCHKPCLTKTRLSDMWFVCDYCPEEVKGSVPFCHHRRACMSRLGKVESSNTSTQKIKDGLIVTTDKRFNPAFDSPISPTLSHQQAPAISTLLTEKTGGDLKESSVVVFDDKHEQAGGKRRSTMESTQIHHDGGSFSSDITVRDAHAPSIRLVDPAHTGHHVRMLSPVPPRGRRRRDSSARPGSHLREESRRRNDSRRREAMSIHSKASIISARPLIHHRSLSWC